VRQSGGYITVETELGNGSTFKIYLPEVAAEPAQPAEPFAAPAAERGTETILLVEDREEVRNVMAQTLRGLGYVVLEADGSQRAVELAQNRSRPIHLLLTDVVMPVMAGFELADVIRTYQSGLKVLFTSGGPDAPRLAEKLSEPGVAYLQKPFTPQGLAASVREILDRH
jgi:CheY-like chemotaxis protein